MAGVKRAVYNFISVKLYLQICRRFELGLRFLWFRVLKFGLELSSDLGRC